MTFIMMIVVSVVVGVLAQKWKARTGALWAFLSLAVMVPVWFVLYFGTSMTDASLYKRSEGWYALGILVSGGVGLLMVLIIATLPKR
jgi:hypothetical protein